MEVSLSTSSCALCGKIIQGKSISDSDLIFDTETCRETYRKLASIYGHNISDMGLPDVINANFFFIDIVGLSDPLLSIKRQMQKIEVLNELIGSCVAFATSKNKRIALPTGDGMVIAFLLNPEMPLKLSIQLHHKLEEYNKSKTDDERIGIRIGLSSGPVFILNDINNNKNLWGPGIVLARRVMDLGDNLHILITDRLAEELISLSDEYRNIIKLVSEYEIKHGQIIKLYSAYSADFGNTSMPEKIQSHLASKNRSS
jgi:class 3 adenylate cyclase